MVWYNVFIYAGQIEQILFYFTETTLMLSTTMGSKQTQRILYFSVWPEEAMSS